MRQSRDDVLRLPWFPVISLVSNYSFFIKTLKNHQWWKTPQTNLADLLLQIYNLLLLPFQTIQTHYRALMIAQIINAYGTNELWSNPCFFWMMAVHCSEMISGILVQTRVYLRSIQLLCFKTADSKTGNLVICCKIFCLKSYQWNNTRKDYHVKWNLCYGVWE